MFSIFVLIPKSRDIDNPTDFFVCAIKKHNMHWMVKMTQTNYVIINKIITITATNFHSQYV